MLEILKKYFFHKGEIVLTSIIDKLKDLVAALEEGPTSEQQEQKVEPPPVPEMSPEVDELLLEDEDILEEQVEVPEMPNYLECSDQETAVILARIENVKLAKVALAELHILFEEKKRRFLSQIEERNLELLKDLDSLRLEYGLPQEGYTVQLPSGQDSKVSFVKN
tara:strand:+ start:807 stop:1301 length:495 start_codon:yes stop_codon:yes gene_type:complete